MLRLFPADRIAFQFGGPGSPIIVPEITKFRVYEDEECTVQLDVFDLDEVALPDNEVSTDAAGLLNEFLVENGTRVWALAQVLGATPVPLDAAFGPRITELEGAQTGDTIDHGNLLGLADDDHPQYLTEARGDARYPTAASVTAALAAKASNAALTAEQTARQNADNTLQTNINAKADSGHTHAISGVTNLQATLDAKATNAALTTEANARIAADDAMDVRMDAVEARPLPDVTAADLAVEITDRQAADTALDGRLDAVEARPVPDVTAADLATHSADTTGVHGIANTADLVLTSDARLSDARTPLAHTHTSAGITDLAEFIQDTVAATLIGSGVTVTYDDASDSITLTAVGGGGGGLDEEAVRDAIGVAMVGLGLISVTPNDGADTITITTTATANATDAALRDRTTHTGEQAIATVTGLQAALDAKAAALGADDNYVTDAEKAALHSHANQGALDAVSGTNTGDQTWSTLPGKPTTFAPIIGSGAGDAVAGNDSRLTDARTPTAHTHPASAISDSTATGRSVVTAANAATARAAIGAGTSDLAVGPGAGDAKPGNYQPASTDISDSTSVGRAVVTAATQAAARTAIGAGTGNSNLAVGTGPTDAKAGDYQPTAANISDATTVGRNVLTAASQAAARTAIGAAATTDIVAQRTIYPFSKAGAQVVATGAQRLYNDTGRTLTIVTVRATVGTAPTGASLIVDVNKNGTTLFTTQSNRPTIAAAGVTATAAAVQVTSWAAGEYLTVDVDQIGSTVAGSDLVVTVTVEG